MSLRSQLGRVRGSILGGVHRRTVPLGDSGPVVSFTFDDFPRTAYSAGGAILESFGARGTYYVAAGLANTSSELGQMFSEHDLQSLLEQGHEIASHTFQHSSCRSVSLSAFQADVQKGMQAVERLTGCSSRNFAYPYGDVTLAAKKALAPSLASARSILPGFNGPEIDLNLLRANRLYGDIDVSRPVEDAIRQNVQQKSWLIFYTHDVRPKPSAYGCTPALFEFAVSAASHSGSRILTVGQVLSEIGIEPATAPAAPQPASAVSS
jgi:peptidoglycan/xylan/chitin deacetylase (PgdA/CDA1 family)